jgi:rubrerythrin
MKKETCDLLKQLYKLEKFQLNYYHSQLSSNEDAILNKAITKILKINKKHVACFDQILTRTNIGESIIADKIADISGTLVGESMEYTGPKNTCRIAVSLERKALKMYYELTKDRSLDPEIFDIILDFQLDKEFHLLWLQHYTQLLKQDSTELLNNVIEDHPTINVNMRLI